MQQGSREDGNIYMLPLKREQECGDAFCHCHQALIICTEQGEMEGRSPVKLTAVVIEKIFKKFKLSKMFMI